MSGRQQHAPVRSGFVQLHDGREALQPAHVSHSPFAPSFVAAPTAAAAVHGRGQGGNDDEGHNAPEALDSYEEQHMHDNIIETVAHTSGEDDTAQGAQADLLGNNRDGVSGDNDEEENEENEDDAAEHNFPELFESWDELESYIREFAAQSYQVFRIRSTVSVRARNANLLKLKKNTAAAADGSSANTSPPMLLADAWKFYSKTYTCTHGLSYQPSEKRLQKSAPLAVRASGCKARINASVSYNKAEKRHCVRAVVRGWHNHPTNREKYYSYVENRRITDPALLDTIARLEGQGEKAKAIYDVLARHVLETTGKECVFQQQDVRNVVFRLQTEKRKQKKARVAAAAPDTIRQFINDANQQRERDDDGHGGEQDYEDYREASVDELTAYPREYSAASSITNQITPENTNIRGPKRKTRAPRMAVPPAILEALERPNDAQTVKLSCLEMMMDSASCYALSHGYVGHMAVVAVETVPKRITKFKHEVVRIPPSFQVEDVAFVLPKYVVDGCEQRIVDTCRVHRLLPPAVGVTLSVQKRGSQIAESVTLTSRQLRTMKRYYFAIESMSQVRKFSDWISFMGAFETRHSNIPFDECYNDPKDYLTYPLSTMALAKVNVSGTSLSPRGALIRFADAIHGTSLLKFQGGPGAKDLDADCVKAVLLHLHSRFHASGSFVNPSFIYEADAHERRRLATLYGAFLTSKQFTAGLMQLLSDQWGAFFLDTETKVCYLYVCDGEQAEYSKLQVLVTDLCGDFDVKVAEFKQSPACPLSVTTTPATDSGVLALLFVELKLFGKTWADVPVDSVDYLRCRYMRQAIQVLNKQDVHLIQWN